MKVLVACEESQRVCQAFRDLGHEAYSCDVLPTSGQHPEWHIQDDVLNVIKRQEQEKLEEESASRISFGRCVVAWKWDLMIAHPPCTYLSNSGVTWLWEGSDGHGHKIYNCERWDKMREAADFFKKLLYAPIPHIVIENPIQHKYAREEIGVSWGQQIHPWQFGHMEQKPTCLWLKNVAPLKPTNNVYDEMKKLPANQRQRVHYMSPGPNRSRDRARTYLGIARAMAEQWGGDIRQQAGDQHE